MRIGHAGVALAAKGLRPTIPLWLLLCAAYAPDILEIALRGFGYWNRALSHSLVSVAIGATVLAAIYAAKRRSMADASVLWLTYVLHWPADFLTGTKPTWPGGPEVGLSLYDRPVVAWIIDLAALAAGWWIYRRRAARIETRTTG
jgi:hypothetical protein